MQNKVERFYLLDILRGFASLSVVVWHYQHFFFAVPGQDAAFNRAAQPFYALLFPFYEQGARAVQLFFVLSGFIFFTLYRDPIHRGKVDGWKFAVLRFSRLYPLHFVTLLWVTLIQILSHTQLGHFLIYPLNDFKHFALNIFLVSAWGFESGHSFNEPIWSVSLEVLYYFIFFLFVKNFRATLSRVTGFALLALLSARLFPIFGIGLFAFFLGGITAFVSEKAKERWIDARMRLFLAGSAMGLGIIAFLLLRRMPDSLFRHFVTGFAYEATLFPALVFSLVLLQSVWSEAGKKWQWIGDITYSAYLLHVPMQMTILAFCLTTGHAIDFLNPVFFLLFHGAILGASILCFHGFEMPVQNLLRKALMNGRQPAPSKPVSQPLPRTPDPIGNDQA